MALKKPLVLDSNGHPSQLQAGDTLDAVAANPTQISGVNSNASAVTIGQVVYIDGAGSFDLAQADAVATADVNALVVDASIAAAATGNYQTDGVVTSADWTAVIGATNLTAGAEYFLDPNNAGQMTTTLPTATGDFVTIIGRALSTTEFLIDVNLSIRL